MTYSSGREPWATPPTGLAVGDLIRMPDHRVYVVGFVNGSRARVHPLTPTSRVILVKDKLNRKRKIEKEVLETGEPMDVSPNSHLPRVTVEDLTDPEFTRLTWFIESGGEFPV